MILLYVRAESSIYYLRGGGATNLVDFYHHSGHVCCSVGHGHVSMIILRNPPLLEVRKDTLYLSVCVVLYDITTICLNLFLPFRC
jgi:hypothetical protein